MNLLAGLIAQVVHVALMAAATPTIVGLVTWLEARLAGRQGPPVLQPWRDLIRLLRKQPALAESASAVSEFAPFAAVAALAVAICLVPSFTLGMTFAAYGDMFAISGLLAVARCSLALAALDAGSAKGGHAASRTMLVGSMAEPALLLSVFAFGLLAGSLNIDLVVAMRQEGGEHTAPLLAVAALLLVSLSDAGILRRDALAMEFSGARLALFQLSSGLRLLLWFNLIGCLLLPFGIAGPGTDVIAWLVGLICWLARMLLFTALVAAVRTFFPRMQLVQNARMFGVAMLLALLAVLFMFAGMAAA